MLGGLLILILGYPYRLEVISATKVIIKIAKLGGKYIPRKASTRLLRLLQPWYILSAGVTYLSGILSWMVAEMHKEDLANIAANAQAESQATKEPIIGQDIRKAEMEKQAPLDLDSETIGKPISGQSPVGDAPLQPTRQTLRIPPSGRLTSTGVKNTITQVDRKVTKRVRFADPIEQDNSQTPEPESSMGKKRAWQDIDLEDDFAQSEPAVKRGRQGASPLDPRLPALFPAPSQISSSRSFTDYSSGGLISDGAAPQVAPYNHSVVALERLGMFGNFLKRFSKYACKHPSLSTMRMTRTARESWGHRIARTRSRTIRLELRSPKLSLSDWVPTNGRRIKGKRADLMDLDVSDDRAEDLEIPDADPTDMQQLGDAEMLEVDDETLSFTADPMDWQVAASIRYRRGNNRGFGRGRIGSKKLEGRFGRTKDQLRTTSKVKASSRMIASMFVGVSAHSSQQHAAPVSMPVTAIVAATNILPAVAHYPISTNSAADLKAARLGKRAEATAAPAQVSGPPPSLATESALPTTSLASTGTGNGPTSDTTQTNISPASTLPSSTPSTPPFPPLTGNTASVNQGSTKPASGKAVAKAPEKRNAKRGCEESVGDLEQSTVNHGNGSMPVSASPEISAASRILAKPKNRKVPATSNDASKVADDQVPGASIMSQPLERSGEQSSKRVQQQHPVSARSDQEIIPLNDIAGQAPSLEQLQKDELQAQFDCFPHAEFGEPDLDWSSSEDDEPPVVRARIPTAGNGKR